MLYETSSFYFPALEKTNASPRKVHQRHRRFHRPATGDLSIIVKIDNSSQCATRLQQQLKLENWMSHLLFSAIAVFFPVYFFFFVRFGWGSCITLFHDQVQHTERTPVEANRCSLLLKSFSVVNLYNLVGVLWGWRNVKPFEDHGWNCFFLFEKLWKRFILIYGIELLFYSKKKVKLKTQCAKH